MNKQHTHQIELKNWKEVYRKRFGLCDGGNADYKCDCEAEIRFIEKLLQIKNINTNI